MLKANDYLKTVRRPYAPLFANLYQEGYANQENYKGLIVEPYYFKDLITSNNEWFYSKEQLKQSADLTYKNWSDPKKFNRAVRELKNREKDLNKSLNSSFKDFCFYLERYSVSVIIAWSCENLVENKVKGMLIEKLGEKSGLDLFEKISFPLEDNFYKKEEIDLIKTKSIRAHVKKYEWINSRYGEKHPYTIEEARNKLCAINKKQFIKKQIIEKSKLRKNIKKAKKILGENSHFVDFMQFLIFYRTQRTDVLNRAIYFYIPKLEKLAQSKGLTYSELIHCSKNEILGLLPSKKEIESRMVNCCKVIENGETYLFSGEYAKKIDLMFKEDFSGIKEFKGQVANKGFAKGVVKVVKQKSDFLKIKAGDILVTSMTTPEMIPLMKKAIAFVTDEGGITCHAAIISRELNKPCIIGTKNATKVLKDGDYVEVDANFGIVKILIK
jgi:phosphohistidine swiveling domain-containing protein